MPANSVRIANPFIYGRVLGSQDAACPRSTYERAIEEAIANRGRLALVGDRRLGKSTLVERTHQVLGAPLLHWDFHKIYSAQDLVHRAAEDLERFVPTDKPKGIFNSHRAMAIQCWRSRRLFALEDDVRCWTANGFMWSGNFVM